MSRARLICGVDEAGRGPLAGPVYAAAVILDKKRRINGLADSKVLPAERREVLVLSRFEYKSYDEIAQVLDCSVGAVKVRVHRAMKQLRDIYLDMAGEVSA